MHVKERDSVPKTLDRVFPLLVDFWYDALCCTDWESNSEILDLPFSVVATPIDSQKSVGLFLQMVNYMMYTEYRVDLLSRRGFVCKQKQ